MRKLLVLLTIGILFVGEALAVTMCVKTNTFISVYRSNVDGTSAECSNSDSDKIWKVVYDYRTITGFASCNAMASSTDPTTVGATGATTGVNCWCRMAPVTTYTNGDPTGVVSYWVFLKTYDSDAACADTATSGCSESRTGCTAECMKAMKTDSTFRSTIFNTIW